MLNCVLYWVFFWGGGGTSGYFNKREVGRGGMRACLFLLLEGPGFEFLLVFCLVVCNFSQVGVWDSLMKVMFLEGAEVR